jgi:probable phosphoglycerate mutase
MPLYLVRHGETEWNVERRLQGQGDSPLTPRGLSQVRAYGELLRQRLAAAETEICLSPLPRTRHTAALLAELLNVSADRCAASELLRERHCGTWEGLRREDLAARHGAEESRRLFRAWDVSIGDHGESLAEVHARAQRWLAEPRTRANTIVVTHGIMSRVFRGAYLSLAPSDILALPSHSQDRVFYLDAGSVTDLLVPEPA